MVYGHFLMKKLVMYGLWYVQIKSFMRDKPDCPIARDPRTPEPLLLVFDSYSRRPSTDSCFDSYCSRLPIDPSEKGN